MRRHSSVLVGRAAEVRTLDDRLSEARDGHGGAVFITGESGIGKSRLAAVATELANAAGMCLMRGRASAVGPAAPFRPLTEAILYLLRVEDIDPDDLGSYGPVLGRVVPEWATRTTDRDTESLVVLAEAVLRLTGLAGRDRGCLLTLDDLHDADAETLAVLEYLIDNVDLERTLLVGGIRDGDSPALALARDAAQRGRATLIELDRLSTEDLRGIAGACLEADPADVPAAAIDLLFAGSGGNPFMAEEVLKVMVDDEVLVGGGGTWSLTDAADLAPSMGLARPLARRVAGLGPRTRDLLAVAATFGARFPLAVVQRVTGLNDHVVLSLLHDLADHLVMPDEHLADWYTFHHQLSRDAVLAQLGHGEQAVLAGRVADAVEALNPGLPGEWCEVTARLRLDAGERASAGRLYAEVGRRALTRGAAASAVAVLDRAWELLADDPSGRANTLEQLLLALAEAGLVDRMLATVDTLDQVSGLTPRRRAALHTRLAWALEVAGRVADAQAQVDVARALLGPDASAEDLAPIDVVAAHIALDRPGSDQRDEAERLARRAATVAEEVPLPVVACQAWQLLGAITRHRDPHEATACLERAYTLAVRHRLPISEIHVLIRLGNDDALRSADLTRLERAREQAIYVGAVTARYQAESSIALHAILRGDHETARALIDTAVTATGRLRLLETTRYVLLLRVVLAAHRGDRAAMTDALGEFGRNGGDLTLHAPRVHGLAGAFCALLEEDRDRAVADLALAVSGEDNGSSVYYLSGRYGLNLLLGVLTGTAGWPDYRELTANPASVLRWDRQFTGFARAVLLGRDGNHDEAATEMAAALELGEPYGTSRHLALRLVGEEAQRDGWGDPVAWLRTAERYFHDLDVPAVAGACRALLRRAGARVPQRRTGADQIPQRLRSAGVTVREFEVLGLLIGRLGNQEIADRLQVSPRTVERHVGNLMTKTGLPNRIALGRLAADVLHTDDELV